MHSARRSMESPKSGSDTSRKSNQTRLSMELTKAASNKSTSAGDSKPSSGRKKKKADKFLPIVKKLK